MRRRRWLLNALLFVVIGPLPQAGAQGASDTQGMGETPPAAAAEASPESAPAATEAAPTAVDSGSAYGPAERPRVSYGGVDYFLPAPRDKIVLPANMPQTYTVVAGDTLWAISRRLMGDPMLWPMLWEVNVATVPNPHRIYPGQVLNLPAGAVVAPGGEGPVAVGTDGRPLRGNFNQGKGDGDRGPDYIRGGYAFEDLFDPTAPRPAAKDATMATAGFISPSDYEGPRIADAELPHPDIGPRDVVYLDIGSSNGVTAGATYEVIRQRRPVFEPGGTYSQVGVLMQQVGRIQIVCVQEETAIAVVTKAYTSMERGDFVIPYTKREAPMVTRSADTDVCEPARGEVKGQVLDAQKGGYRTSDAAVLGTGDVVYFDVGQEDNVAPGQYFVIFRKSRLGNRYPLVQIGEAVVLAVEQETSTAMVTNIRQDVFVGDRIQLK